jgi:hypothetical protein
MGIEKRKSATSLFAVQGRDQGQPSRNYRYSKTYLSPNEASGPGTPPGPLSPWIACSAGISSPVAGVAFVPARRGSFAGWPLPMRDLRGSFA